MTSHFSSAVMKKSLERAAVLARRGSGMKTPARFTGLFVQRQGQRSALSPAIYLAACRNAS